MPGKLSNAEDYSPECYKEGVVAVGWNELGDLNAIKSKEKLRQMVERRWGREAEHGARTIAQWVGALWAFSSEVRPGHYVICPDKVSKRFYVGEVLSDVFYDKPTIGGRCPFAHRRNVKWWDQTLDHESAAKIWPRGKFGGLQTVSRVPNGENRLKGWLRKPRRASASRQGLPIAPDMEWGRNAEARAFKWLKDRGYSPKDVSLLNKGWDISCGEDRFEVKGRKSRRTAIRLTQNEWAAANRFRKQYTVLIFTASNKEALRKADPRQLANPAKSASWTPRVVYEYVLNE